MKVDENGRKKGLKLPIAEKYLKAVKVGKYLKAVKVRKLHGNSPPSQNVFLEDCFIVPSNIFASP